MRQQKQLAAREIPIGLKKKHFHYESELKLEMEQEPVAQKGCGTAILGDVQNLMENHRIVGVGRDLCGSSSPTLLPKQGHLQ